MKRYNIFGSSYSSEESLEGEWVRYEDAQKHIEELEIKINWVQSVINNAMLPEKYVLMPIEPSLAMIQAMVWWCPELSLSTGDLVEFYQDMIRAEHDKEQEDDI